MPCELTWPFCTRLRDGSMSILPRRKPTSPNMSPSPSGPTWALWRTSPSGGLIMSPERTSRSFSFFPFLGVVVFKYMGVFAGILLLKSWCEVSPEKTLCCSSLSKLTAVSQEIKKKQPTTNSVHSSQSKPTWQKALLAPSSRKWVIKVVQVFRSMSATTETLEVEPHTDMWLWSRGRRTWPKIRSRAFFSNTGGAISKQTLGLLYTEPQSDVGSVLLQFFTDLRNVTLKHWRSVRGNKRKKNGVRGVEGDEEKGGNARGHGWVKGNGGGRSCGRRNEAGWDLQHFNEAEDQWRKTLQESRAFAKRGSGLVCWSHQKARQPPPPKTTTLKKEEEMFYDQFRDFKQTIAALTKTCLVRERGGDTVPYVLFCFP